AVCANAETDHAANATNANDTRVMRSSRLRAPRSARRTTSRMRPAQRSRRLYGNCGGATRFFVACSKAYASSINFGSLQAMPVKLTPIGPGFASNPAGNGGVGSFGIIANGTVTVG